MPQLDFATYPSQFLWLFIIFFLQYMIMAKVVVPGFRKIYKKRQEFIDTEVAQAEKLIKQAEKLKLDYETKILEAKAAHIKAMNETVAELQKLSDQKIAKIENQLATDLKTHEQELRSLEKSVLEELDSIAIVAASTIVTKLTKTTVKASALNKYMN